MFIQSIVLIKSKTVLTALMAGAAIATGVLTFGNGELFDRLFLLILVFLMFFKAVNQDINISGIIILFIVNMVCEEVVFLTLGAEYQKIIIYTVAAYIFYRLYFNDMVKFIAVPILLLSFIAELHWFLTDYPAPMLHLYIAMLTFNILIRFMLFMRIPLTEQYTNKKAKIVPADSYIYDLAKWSTIFLSLVLIEYIVRHCTPYQPMLIYNLFEYVMHGLAVLIVIIIGSHIINSQKSFSV